MMSSPEDGKITFFTLKLVDTDISEDKKKLRVQ
jgi:hypothetical protein